MQIWTHLRKSSRTEIIGGFHLRKNKFWIFCLPFADPLVFFHQTVGHDCSIKDEAINVTGIDLLALYRGKNWTKWRKKKYRKLDFRKYWWTNCSHISLNYKQHILLLLVPFNGCLTSLVKKARIQVPFASFSTFGILKCALCEFLMNLENFHLRFTACTHNKLTFNFVLLNRAKIDIKVRT